MFEETSSHSRRGCINVWRSLATVDMRERMIMSIAKMTHKKQGNPALEDENEPFTNHWNAAMKVDGS